MNDERARLHREAEQLKAARLSRGIGEERAAALAQREQEAEGRRFSAGRLRASVVHQPGFLYALLGSCALIAFVLPLDPDLGTPPVPLRLVAHASLTTIFCMVVWRFHGPTRYRLWLASLPFPVEGLTELLGCGRAVRDTRIELRFKDTPAPKELIEELLLGRLPQGEDDPQPKLSRTEAGTFISCSLSRESSNRVLYGFFSGLATKVLADVHRAYPLQLVRVEATDLADFARPTPD